MSDAALRRWGPTTGITIVAFLAGWAARVPDAPIPQVVLRTVRGPVRTVEVPAEPYRDPVTAVCAEEDRVAVGLLGLPEDVAPEPPATESACRARIALATAVTTGRQLDLLGTPMPFPEDLPEEFREAAVTEVARRVAETCPDIDLRRVDCSEFPCLALFVMPTNAGSVSSCPAWREAYGSETTGPSETLVGPDGERLTWELVGPPPPPRFWGSQPSGEEVAMGVTSNVVRRMLARGSEARDEVMAALGARELSREEVRERSRELWRREIEKGGPEVAEMLEQMEEVWAAEDARSP